MKKQLLSIVLASFMALAFLLGISPAPAESSLGTTPGTHGNSANPENSTGDQTGNGISVGLPEKDSSITSTDVSEGSHGKNHINDGQQNTVSGTAPTIDFMHGTEQNKPAAPPEPSYQLPEFPSDAIVYTVYINGRRMPQGFGALVNGVIYLPFEGFFAATGTSTEKQGAVCHEGDSYIVCGERCIPCSDSDLTVTVKDFGCLCVPIGTLASAAGMDVTQTNAGIKNDTSAVSASANVTASSSDSASSISSTSASPDTSAAAISSVTVVISGIPSYPTAKDVYGEEDLYWLSRIISAESRGEPFEGQLAVGCVVLNRTRCRSYPDTVKEVVFDNKFGIQFTPAHTGSVYNAPTASSVTAAKLCLEGFSLSDSILFFFNSSIAAGSWITSNRTYTMTVGRHDFYS